MEKSLSLKDRIIQYCQERPFEWIHKGTLGRLAVLEWGYENENMGRRCRELENDGLLERREIKSKDGIWQVEYRYKKFLQRVRVKVEEAKVGAMF